MNLRYVQKYVRNREVLIKNQAKEIKDLQRQRICGIVPVEYYSSIPRISGTKSRPVSGKVCFCIVSPNKNPFKRVILCCVLAYGLYMTLDCFLVFCIINRLFSCALWFGVFGV
eukprot:TRINITY_DN3014_c0_g2_i16.p1 TRINITY_DN3014_c0_g2~~TRINITY_DN3014_c0_g2_i16.p1  ORF type:complete len:113 (-),score=6.20 TRINITY_DN3014_c0_g2_i16:931-1269(-)